MFKDLGPRHHATGFTEKQFEQAELGVGERNPLAIAGHLAAIGIDHQIAQTHHTGASGRLPGLGGGRTLAHSPQDGGDAGLQFLGAERFGQIIIGAEVEAGYPLRD